MSWTDQTLEPDTEKRNRVIEKIAHCEPENIYDYVRSILPEWIRYTCKRYTSDYALLETNWKNLCAQWKTTPKRILIVQFLPSREDFERLAQPSNSSNLSSYSLIGTCCNLLTRNGFVIRAESELVPCIKCEQAMLSERVYNYLLENKSTLVSGVWNACCKECREN
jgi:hypothetical protein